MGDSVLAQYSRSEGGPASSSKINAAGYEGEDNILYEQVSDNRLKNLTFSVLDSIVNVGPIADSVIGHIPLAGN